MTGAARALTPAEAAALIGAGPALLEAELRALPEGADGFHPAPGEWCAREVLGHLIECDRRGFAGRIDIILAADSPALAGWDQDAVARARDDCHRDTGDLLRELATMRAESVKRIAELRPADLARLGRHPKVGDLRVADLLHEWVHHDRNHIRQIQANVQAFVWPHMGNAQRFSAAG